MEVQIILPPVDDSLLSSLLVKLTEKIDHVDSDSVAHGFLGGEHGYGARFENDVFMMHPFCWCEKDDCPWCKEGDTEPNFRHKKSGLEVWWYKYIGRSMEVKNAPADLLPIFQECLDSIKPSRDSDNV